MPTWLTCLNACVCVFLSAYSSGLTPTVRMPVNMYIYEHVKVFVRLCLFHVQLNAVCVRKVAVCAQSLHIRYLYQAVKRRHVCSLIGT